MKTIDTNRDRLMDSLLQQYAKGGPDEAFLADLESAIDGEEKSEPVKKSPRKTSMSPLAWAALLVASVAGIFGVQHFQKETATEASLTKEESVLPAILTDRAQAMRLRVEEVVSPQDQTPTRISFTYKVDGKDVIEYFTRGVNWPARETPEGATFPFHIEKIQSGRTGLALYLGRMQAHLVAAGADSTATNNELVVNVNHLGNDAIPSPSIPSLPTDLALIFRDAKDLTAFGNGFSCATLLRTYFANDVNVVPLESPAGGDAVYPHLTLFTPEKRFGVRAEAIPVSFDGQLNYLSNAPDARVRPLDLKSGSHNALVSHAITSLGQHSDGTAWSNVTVQGAVFATKSSGDRKGLPNASPDPAWPMASGTLSGFDPSTRYSDIPPITVDLRNLPPDGRAYVRVYRGINGNGVETKILPASKVTGAGTAPQDRKFVLQDVNNHMPKEGPYTIELVHETASGTDVLYSGLILADRTCSVKASIFTTNENAGPRPATSPRQEVRLLPYPGRIVRDQFAPQDRERYGQLVDQPWHTPWNTPLSTFSVDVDTASYTNVRRLLQSGATVPKDSVRLEEFLNYFDYGYPAPVDGGPFAVHVDLATCPWKEEHFLAKIGIKGREVNNHSRPPSNLVFLIDVSGSMQSADKLPLLVESMKTLVEELDERDRVGIVVYAGSAGTVLEPTPVAGDKRELIMGALDRLSAGGSTAGAAGIRGAYELAARHYRKGGVNRVILATDGDFNVGTSSKGELVELVKEKAKSGTYLSVLGFGTGNLNDGMLEAISNDGNGNYFYIDNRREGRKVFLQNLSGTLVTIAKDVKLQVEFNPSKVAAYRLIGYANRILRDEDFNNDKVDAGDIGAGHTVTALYEIVPVGAKLPDIGGVDPLKYQKPANREAGNGPEWMTVKLRYKKPDGDKSTLLAVPVEAAPIAWRKTSPDYLFAAAVALFGEKLRESDKINGASWQDVGKLAKRGVGQDRHGYRKEFLELVGFATDRHPGADPVGNSAQGHENIPGRASAVEAPPAE